MSTKSSYGLYDEDGLSVHVYHELSDGLCHMEIDYGPMSGYINVILPADVGNRLGYLLDHLPETIPNEQSSKLADNADVKPLPGERTGE